MCLIDDQNIFHNELFQFCSFMDNTCNRQAIREVQAGGYREKPVQLWTSNDDAFEHCRGAYFLFFNRII